MQLRNLILRELLEWGPPTIKPDQFVQGLIAELRNKPLICTLLGIERSMEADLGEAIDLGQCEIDDKTLAISAIRGIVAGKIIEFFQTGLAAGEVGSDTQYVYTHYEIYPGFKEKRFLLETLGREAVKLACSDDFFHRYPDANEGELSSARSVTLDYHRLTLLHRTLMASTDYSSTRNFNAVAGVLSLVLGMDGITELIKKLVINDLSGKLDFLNAQTLLQRVCDKKRIQHPCYVAKADADGFIDVAVFIGKEVYPRAKGRAQSESFARKIAAYNALYKLGAKNVGETNKLRPKSKVSTAYLTDEELYQFQSRIGIRLSDQNLLKTALISKPYAQKEIANERLEFLGDSVLGFLIAQSIYANYDAKAPSLTREGVSRIFRRFVKSSYLARVGQELGIHTYIKTGRDDDLENAVEATIGAIYVDQGIDAAEKFVRDFVVKDSLNTN